MAQNRYKKLIEFKIYTITNVHYFVHSENIEIQQLYKELKVTDIINNKKVVTYIEIH